MTAFPNATGFRILIEDDSPPSASSSPDTDRAVDRAKPRQNRMAGTVPFPPNPPPARLTRSALLQLIFKAVPELARSAKYDLVGVEYGCRHSLKSDEALRDFFEAAKTALPTVEVANHGFCLYCV